MHLVKDAETEAAPTPEPWVGLEVVAKHLDIKKQTVGRMARARTLPGHKFPNGARSHWRFKLSEVDAFIKAGTPG